MKLLAPLLLLIFSSSFGQTINYQNLLNTALKGHGSLFLCSKPLKISQLNPKEMWLYVENLRAYSAQRLDTTMFSQIIQNSLIADTTLWTDNELQNFILVNERAETVSKRYVIQKFKLTDKKEVKHLNKYINKFNSTDPVNRVVCYYSRPVYDNSKTFAVVQWDNGHSHLRGGGGIKLYHLQGETWKEIGDILHWRY